jgi:hypothetical protein
MQVQFYSLPDHTIPVACFCGEKFGVLKHDSVLMINAMKMETTHVSETSTLYIHTLGNYPKEDNIRFSTCPMKMETTHVFETSTLYIHTPGNYPKEDNIRELK